jgi:two-component system response regulator DevR
VSRIPTAGGGTAAGAAAGPVRILVVDDHTIVRQGLRSILELEPDFTVIGEAANPEEAVAQAARLRPDVVLLDLKLSDAAPAEGLDVCAALRSRRPDAAIVVLTTGASGYALKDVDAVELARIIRAVHRGDSAFDSRSAHLVVQSLTARSTPSAGVLSERELEIVRPVARGATNPQVARELYLSESTVKFHLRTAMRKLGARDRTELVFKASELGLL